MFQKISKLEKILNGGGCHDAIKTYGATKIVKSGTWLGRFCKIFEIPQKIKYTKSFLLQMYWKIEMKIIFKNGCAFIKPGT